MYLKNRFVGSGWFFDEAGKKEALQQNSIETDSNFQQKFRLENFWSDRLSI